MKTIRYALRTIHKKELILTAKDRKTIEKMLELLLESEKASDEAGGELVGIAVEEEKEIDCTGECEICEHFCPQMGECMAGESIDHCKTCEFHCKACGSCILFDGGTCSDADCEECQWICKTCGCCMFPPALRRL